MITRNYTGKGGEKPGVIRPGILCHKPTFASKPLLHTTWRCSSNNGYRRHEEGDNDEDIAAELGRYAKQAQQQHLDLLWSVSSEKSTTECQTCHGSGEVECPWCHGTGALTVGDTLFCDNIQGCRHCPVCNGVGFLQCMSCKGAGKRATWMKS